METRVKVYGKAQNRIALGIINAYMDLHPQATLKDLQKAFPDTINPDCGGKHLFMTEKDINAHLEKGEKWYASARGYFVNSGEWLVMPDGECVAFVSMWTKPSLDRLIEQAKQYCIEAVVSDEKQGTFRIEHIDVAEPAEKDENVFDGVKKMANNIFKAASTAIGDATKFVGEQISSIINGDNDTESNSFAVTYDGEDYPMALQYKGTTLEYPALTVQLDKYKGKELTLDDINKITLWKIGRFPFMTPEALVDLNSLKDEKTLDVEKTTAVLKELLNTTGIGLPMASTYLRFINPDVYQIIDVRAFRAAFDYERVANDYQNNTKSRQITIYIEYLEKLREIADNGYHGFSTEFCNLDRFLYNFDKQAAKLSCVIRKEEDSEEAWDEAISRTLENCDEITDDDVVAIKEKGMCEFVVSYDDCQYSMSLQYNNTDEEYPTLKEDLDKLQGKELTLFDIYRITLWKIARYPFMTPETLADLNLLKDEKTFDEDKTKAVLDKLLNTKGVGLPMASTYLRFINPDVYQIIDVRAYRAAFDYENDESDYKYEDNHSKTETYIDYLQKLREIEKNGYHGLSTAFCNLDRFLYNFDKITVMGAQNDWSDNCWDKAIRRTIGECNSNVEGSAKPEILQPEHKSDGVKKTYRLRIEADSFYEIHEIGLENAEDNVIEEGFENGENWVELVGNTYTGCGRVLDWKQDIGEYDEEDVESVEPILNMIDDEDIESAGDRGPVFADAEENFRIVVLDDDDEKIDTIDGSDIRLFEVHEGYNPCVDFIEDDATRQMASDYLMKNDLLDKRCSDFFYKDGWSWVNIIKGEICGDYPAFTLETNGEFDPDKLMIIKNYAYDLGDNSISAITGIIYDGEQLEQDEEGEVEPSEGQSFDLFINRDNPTIDAAPNAIFNMSTMEKA